MINVLTELCQWAGKLPYWEQVALDRILSGTAFGDADYDQLHQYLLEDAGLENRVAQRPGLQFASRTALPDEAAAKPVRLRKMSNLENVNALMSGQSLSFGPALTAVFGGNGSGKSGYARVLGCAGFTRGDKEVLPDVTRPICGDATSIADIEFNDGVCDRTVRYQVGNCHPDLVSFYVFDSTSVMVHLTKSNTLSFSPAGLSCLGRLAEVTDDVRQRLQAKTRMYSEAPDPRPIFQGESEVSRLLRDPGFRTNIAQLRKLSILTQQDQARLTELDLRIAQLKTQDSSKKMETVGQTAADLRRLLERLQAVRASLSDQVLAEVNHAVGVHRERQAAVRAASIDQFRSARFTHTGSPAWQAFVEAAKRLSDLEGLPDQPYPGPNDHCLLCHQPLSEKARDLILRLWEFLRAEAQTKLEESEALLREKRRGLAGIDVRFFNEESASHRHLSEQSSPLVQKVAAFIEAGRRRASAFVTIVDTLEPGSPKPLPDPDAAEIARVVQRLEASRVELEAKNTAQEIADLQAELLGLQHRALLGSCLPHIEEYVRKRGWVERAGKAGGSTKHITDKHNELFKQLVTDRYIQLFEQTLSDLKRPLKVTAQTRGRKGGALKELVLKVPPGAPMDRARPEKVLSEGEKRAVALADFLTEVALDETSSGVVLDDPVTSLDFEWKETIAQRLVQEARRRQVIVFTHDLHFLYVLKKHAESQQVEIVSHWIKRGDLDDRPGYVFLNNSPLMEKDYRKSDRAREFQKRASKAPPEEQESLLQQGFGALRTSYEAFIIYDLFNEVVLRFDERISFGRLEEVAWDDTIVRQVIGKCGLLSRYIEGHLHSDVYVAQKPTVAMLMQEIEAFDTLKKNLRDLKTQKKAGPLSVIMPTATGLVKQ